MESVDKDMVVTWIKNGCTIQWISEELQKQYPDRRGLSARSVRRFCQKENITKMTENEIGEVVAQSVDEVGEVYGRTMMKGYLESKGIKVSEHKVRSALQQVAPESYEKRRQNTVDKTNPVPYYARYFGHKIHLDQNEKLIQFGCTHVIAVDGFSGKIVGNLTLPVKNNVMIYQEVLRKPMLQYGLWHQLRVDHGREFYLCLFVQSEMRNNYGPSDIEPFRQTPSTQEPLYDSIHIEDGDIKNEETVKKVYRIKYQARTLIKTNQKDITSSQLI